ncbi:unnamed protein product [Agarophyton chilense]|eukprot:gb/GEZJ01001974.1/.p2 GENE.gb/GEZJ01001974.1/~~gb/GEZJ01001974.1/.p2  ORF type:complete len:445 (-),score=74.67 gb/GEZJ01001974.1/:3877-5142(-)
MALGGAARPLLVPAADVLAKNMRAYDPNEPLQPDHLDTSQSSTLFMTIGAVTENDARARKHSVRFRAAKPDSKPNPVVHFFTRLFSAAPNNASAASSAEHAKSALAANLEKLWPPLEKASTIASRLPDPTVLYLALVLAVLLINRYKPHWFHSILVKIAVILSFLPLFAVALLWRKTELFAQLREGRNPLSHPAEHMLDDLGVELKTREDNVKKAQQTLDNNRSKLDALRKELSKDPHASEPNAIIVPSRKAASMIAAGALGTDYDAEASHAVEARRREESVKKSREEWRQKAEEVDINALQTAESVKLLQHHASTAYSKRTREIKTRSVSSRHTDKLKALKKTTFGSLSSRPIADDNITPRIRLSERTATSHANSTASSRRWSLFGRKRRMTNASSPAVRGATSVASSPRITAESAADRP